MRPSLVLLLVLVACMATVPAGAAMSSTDNLHDDRARMLLRAVGEGEDERTLDNSLLSKLKKAFAAFTHKFEISPEVRGWLKTEQTPDDVFKLLKLDDGVETLLENQNLQRWVVFAEEYNKKHRDNKVTLLGMLTKTYGDEEVAKMLVTAKLNPSTEPLASALQNEQIWVWIQNGVSPNYVFKWFRLDKGTVEELLANPALGAWYHFFTNANQFHADRDVRMITQLVDLHGDIPLAKAISATMKGGTMQDVAAKLQEAQFQKWVQLDKKTPDEVSKMFMTGRMGWGHQSIVRDYRTFYENANKVDDLVRK